jgi:hypothetical protein
VNAVSGLDDGALSIVMSSQLQSLAERDYLDAGSPLSWKFLLDQRSPSSNEREMIQFDEQCEAMIKTISHWPVILSVRNF